MSTSSPFLIFNASAGSGKTYTIVKEYLKILFASDNYFKFKEILAITFTNKAVGEMKERIIEMLLLFSENQILVKPNSMFSTIVEELNVKPEKLHSQAKILLELIVHNYAAFDVSTIDKFNHKIIRTFAYDLRIPLNFEIELDTETLLNQAVDNLISKTGNDKALTNIIVDFALEKTDEDRSWDISYDLNKIAKLLVNENHITHLDNLEAKSLSDFQALKKNVHEKVVLLEQQIIDKANRVLNLIDECGLEHTDFSGGSRAYLPNYFLKLEKLNFPNNYDSAWIINLEEKPLYPEKSSTDDIKRTLDDIKPQIVSAFNQSKQDVFQYKLLKNIYKNITPLSVLNAINKELKLIKEEQNILLISEFNSIISNEIKNQPIPFIYERIGEKFKHYFIDEFQDTSELQWQNLMPLVDNVLSSEGGTNLIVGDAKQAIYRWRGGKAEQFINLFNEKNQPFSVDQVIVDLPVNYRSTRQIIDFNNKFFTHLSGFAFSNPDYAKIYAESHQEFSNENEGYVAINLLDYSKDDDKDEVYTQEVLKTIGEIQQNDYQLKDICVLVRRKSEGVAIADALSNEGINIISSETLLLNRSPEVNFVINMMRLTMQPNNNEVKIEILNFIADKQKTGNKHDLFKSLKDLNPSELFKTLSDFDFDAFLQLSIYDAVESVIREFQLTDSSNAYIQFFLDEVLDYSFKYHSSFSGFLKYWEAKQDKLSIVSPAGQNAIHIMTIHKSKGLEFPVVILSYAELNIYREKEAKTWFSIDDDEFNGFDETYINLNKDLESVSQLGARIYNNHKSELELDNINLLYVALTRPIEQLYIIGKKDINTNSIENLNTYSGLFINYLKSTGQWNDSNAHYSFGKAKKQFKSKAESTQAIIQQDFVSTSTKSCNINIITSSGYLWDTSQKKAIERGNLIHLIMSNIKTGKDIEFILNDFKSSGIIDKEQQEEFRKIITNIVEHPQLKDYFARHLIIYNEKDIITKDGKILRPDRIVINKNKEAVIIDYKTGLRNPKYHQQLYEYQDVLDAMGLKTIKKILVYINENISIDMF
ncbi:MAG: UvrD-helicase domain-containing protein [Flavobacteriaceae bacterium]|nr:UvrD-helicase domain-containing protein [Flavobacteriaceae bacterium]